MNDCPKFGKLIRGCKFEARHDIGYQELTHEIIEDLSWAMKTNDDRHISFNIPLHRTYIKDVCVRCGKEILR